MITKLVNTSLEPTKRKNSFTFVLLMSGLQLLSKEDEDISTELMFLGGALAITLLNTLL